MTLARSNGWFCIFGVCLFAVLALASRALIAQCPEVVIELCSFHALTWFLWFVAFYFGVYGAWALWLGYRPGKYAKWQKSVEDAETERAKQLLKGYEK